MVLLFLFGVAGRGGAAWFVRSLCGTEILILEGGLAVGCPVMPPEAVGHDSGEAEFRGFWRGCGCGGNAAAFRGGFVGTGAAASSRTPAAAREGVLARGYDRADGSGEGDDVGLRVNFHARRFRRGRIQGEVPMLALACRRTSYPG